MTAGPLARRPGTLLRLLSAALAGASGLGLEVVAVEAAGLSLGFSLASALGLGAFVAGWALGACAAGRWSRGPGRLLLGAGLASALLAATLPPLLLARGADPGGALASGALALGCVFACGLPQGLFLPALARSERGVAGIFAANLFGSLAGATLIGFHLTAAFGRPAAGLAAGAVALLAGALGAAGSRSAPGPLEPAPGDSSGDSPGDSSGAPRPAFKAWVVVGAATIWMIGIEWSLLRLSVLWIGSRAAALSSVLAASLLALAAGAALLPALLPRKASGVAFALALAVAAQAWPFLAAPTLRAMTAAGRGDFWVVLVLVGPPLFPLGAAVPLLHRALGPGGSGPRLGRLLVHEAWAALLAGPLVHWVLVGSAGVGEALVLMTLLGLPAGLALRPAAPLGGALLAGLSACAALVFHVFPDPVRAVPVLTDPALTVHTLREDTEFTVAVVDDGLLGERTLLTDTFRAAGDGRDYAYMRVLGHLPVLLHPDPERVAVVALGTGTTVGSVSLHPRAGEIDVLEISSAVVDLAWHWFLKTNRGALQDPRVTVRLGDGRRTLASLPGHYDVVTIEPLLPDSPFGVYLYTEGFYAVARRSLRPGGLACQWVPPHALEPEVFDAVLDAFRRAFPWSGVWVFGSQVVLIGAEAAPTLAAQRFPEEGELHAALSELGLDTPAGVAARYVCAGAAWPPAPRRLTDADPWIVYRDKPGGAAALEWLPANLGRLAGLREPAAGWLGPEAAAPGAGELRRALGGLLAARAVQGRVEFELVSGAQPPQQGRPAVQAALAEVAGLGDPEVRAFADQVAFLWAVRDGVARLGAGDPGGAVSALVTAAELRGERADVHLYLATAFGRLGLDEPAARALEAALERCPRLAETPAGRRAEGLGFDPARWPRPLE